MEKSAQQLLETYKRGQKCLSQYWTLWNNEYMLSWDTRKPDSHLIACSQVREVVLINDKLPCGHWKVGKIFRIDCG